MKHLLWIGVLVSSVAFGQDTTKTQKEEELEIDSVCARHILISNGLKRWNPQRAAFILDSLKSELENGASFDSLAWHFNEDPGTSGTGYLGWFGKGIMVKPIEDAVFSGAVGDYAIVTTRFGMHLLEILDQK